MPRPPALVAAVLFLTAGATTAPTTAPTTVPTTSSTAVPTTAPAADAVDPQVARRFDDLCDADPAVRDAAAEWLMGLPRDGLAQLLAVVRAAGPVRPAQAAVLHEIVCQAFLATEPYVATHDDADPTHAVEAQYVMGVRWPDDINEGPARLGVPVVERWPGFPARRLLRDGDMILGVYVDPAAPLTRLPNMTTPRTQNLREMIAQSGGSRRVLLAVLRAGREVRVAMPLIPRPVDASSQAPMAVDTFLGARQQLAEAYWQDHFAPVVSPDDDAPAAIDP